MTGDVPFCVCVPARDEAMRLPVLLEALADQDVGGIVPVAIGLNNTTDRSVDAIEAARLRWNRRLSIQVEAVTFGPALAHAGSARRHAMALGAEVVGHRPDAVLISTDADSRPPASWVGANLTALKDGAEVIGGRLEIDDRDGLTPPMTRARRLWDDYWAAVRSIEDCVDPVPWDPAPRHGDHTGASLAMRVETWQAAGGVPVVPTGEDRALVAAAVALGARLRH
ncbi:MAG: glycosyltransferase family 2 protein, partial [Pseudomonadota bacterium]